MTEEIISQAEYDTIESMEKNHISNISTAHSNIGYLLTLVLNLSVLLPMQGNDFANNLALCLTNSCKLEPTFSYPYLSTNICRNLLQIDWVMLGIWWFIFQQKRPGPKMPKGSNYLTIGLKQVALALREVRHLPQTFIYLCAFFLLADGLNTTGSLIGIIQVRSLQS